MLGERVKTLRQSYGWNQKRLASRSGITQATISRLERGRVRELKAGALLRLANALSVTTDELVGRSIPSMPKDIDPMTRATLKQYQHLNRAARQHVQDLVRLLAKQHRDR